MKRKKRLLLSASLILCLLLAACGSSGGSSAPSTGASAPGEAPQFEADGGWIDAEAGTEPSAAPQTGSGESGVYRDENAKIIRTASLEIQTTEYDQSFQALDSLTSKAGGYYESAVTRGGSYYDQGASRHGSFIIRVPKEQYGSFLDAVGGVGHLVSVSESAEDVGERYYDTESRLRTQRTKLDRLQTLLEQAATMEDIIDLENALAEVEYQIEQLTGELRRYDSLVDYATINVSLSEVHRVSDPPDERAGLGARLTTAFSGGWASFSDGLGNLIVWCAYHFMGILIALAVAAAVAAVVLRRRRLARVRAEALRAAAEKREAEKPEPPEEK